MKHFWLWLLLGFGFVACSKNQTASSQPSLNPEPNSIVSTIKVSVIKSAGESFYYMLARSEVLNVSIHSVGTAEAELECSGKRYIIAADNKIGIFLSFTN